MIDMNNVNEVTKKLEELKSSELKHMSVELLSKSNKNFCEIIKRASEKEIEDIEQYLHKFLDDTSNEFQKCIFTDTRPVLSWGLCHGTMIDSNTGLSWEAYHYLTTNGKECRFERIMQYHPDVYELGE